MNLLSFLSFAWLKNHEGEYYNFLRAVQIHHAVLSSIVEVDHRVRPAKISKFNSGDLTALMSYLSAETCERILFVKSCERLLLNWCSMSDVVCKN